MYTQRKRCGHCDELLTLPVYKRHRDLYFNKIQKEWKQAKLEIVDSEDEEAFLTEDEEAFLSENEFCQ